MGSRPLNVSPLELTSFSLMIQGFRVRSPLPDSPHAKPTNAYSRPPLLPRLDPAPVPATNCIDADVTVPCSDNSRAVAYNGAGRDDFDKNSGDLLRRHPTIRRWRRDHARSPLGSNVDKGHVDPQSAARPRLKEAHARSEAAPRLVKAARSVHLYARSWPKTQPS